MATSNKKTPAEPSLQQFSHSFRLYLAATRPAFFLASLVACLLGLGIAAYAGAELNWPMAALSVCLAFLVHAAVNVLNDYFDADGTDAINIERIYPYTGGSRFIQNGLLTKAQTKRFGYALLLAAIAGGLWLVGQVGMGLLWIGLVGVLIGWAYSASPFRLNSRGWGELCVLLGFLGVVVGMDYVQRREFYIQPFQLGLPYALLVTNLLYANQFPDRKADMQAGKRHWVVRLDLPHAVFGYALITLAAALWLLGLVALHMLPPLALLAFLPLFFSWQAFSTLCQHAAQPQRLTPAIINSIRAMLLHGVLLSFVLMMENL
ncbi:MAG TPA: prenyltransferase [Methylophilus sp.]|nr:prenyltransferase [Methylophilus sp.]HQQ34192.1 prenyltransferase [Methylophilus sp.]